MAAPALFHRQPQRVVLGEKAEDLGDLPRQPSIAQVCTPSLAVAGPFVVTLAFPGKDSGDHSEMQGLSLSIEEKGVVHIAPPLPHLFFLFCTKEKG